MKKLVLVFGLLICCATVGQLSANAGLPVTHVKFLEAAFNWTATTFDFGQIKKDVAVMHQFSFKNNGNTPLVISSVQASCGCTVTDYSKTPIEPGAQGFVKATYNAANVGVFSKTVTVNANTEEGAVQLTIKGVVVE